jgi:hypothetical protein
MARVYPPIEIFASGERAAITSIHYYDEFFVVGFSSGLVNIYQPIERGGMSAPPIQTFYRHRSSIKKVRLCDDLTIFILDSEGTLLHLSNHMGILYSTEQRRNVANFYTENGILICVPSVRGTRNIDVTDVIAHGQAIGARGPPQLGFETHTLNEETGTLSACSLGARSRAQIFNPSRPFSNDLILLINGGGQSYHLLRNGGIQLYKHKRIEAFKIDSMVRVRDEVFIHGTTAAESKMYVFTHELSYKRSYLVSRSSNIHWIGSDFVSVDPDKNTLRVNNKDTWAKIAEVYIPRCQKGVNTKMSYLKDDSILIAGADYNVNRYYIPRLVRDVTSGAAAAGASAAASAVPAGGAGGPSGPPPSSAAAVPAASAPAASSGVVSALLGAFGASAAPGGASAAAAGFNTITATVPPAAAGLIVADIRAGTIAARFHVTMRTLPGAGRGAPLLIEITRTANPASDPNGALAAVESIVRGARGGPHAVTGIVRTGGRRRQHLRSRKHKKVRRHHKTHSRKIRHRRTRSGK